MNPNDEKRSIPFVSLSEMGTYLDELAKQALDDPVTAETLWTFAWMVCGTLWEVCERKPDLIRNFARKKMVFPVNWPLLKGEQKQIFEMLKNLGLGTNAIFHLHRRKQFDPNTPVNEIALSYMNDIHQLQYETRMKFNLQRFMADFYGKKRVPPIENYIRREIARVKDPWLKQVMSLGTLSRANADDWAKTIWQKIMETHYGHPEKDRTLRIMGNYRKNHNAVTGLKKTTGKTAESNIRNGIKKRIFDAVRNLAGST
ncbi:MAG: hypothetical protein ABSC01_14580 [Verrucomicrobiota bacterium]